MPDREENPLLSDWREVGQFPPFETVKPHHFLSAVEQLTNAHMARIDAIAECSDEASFENTIAAFDDASGHLERVAALFEILCLTVATVELQLVEANVSALLAGHRARALTHKAFFRRLDTFYERREAMRLAEDELRLLERIRLDYVRAGIALSAEESARLIMLKERLAELDVLFNRNLVASTDAFKLELSTEEELEGLPEFVRNAARCAGADTHSPKYVFTLKHSSVVAFLTFSDRRDLRERVWHAWTSRCNGLDFDNREIAQEIVTLRLTLARLLGYKCYADFALEDRMAATPDAALSMLREVWGPAKLLCASELDDLRALAVELGEPVTIQPWDWRYLSQKLRDKRFKLDTSQVSEHFALESVVTAAFDCANRLFGLSFYERHDVTLHHRDARLWDVRRNDQTIGYFIADYFARENKQPGAWESEFRMQSNGRSPLLPIVINSASFSRDLANPTLLSIDNVKTVFHEFGHALHCLLSDVRFSRLSGTRVARDFVEFPSHLFENWALQPEVLARHARHIVTGEPIASEMVEQLRASQKFNEGFELVRYLAPALIDIELHSLQETETLNIEAFEKDLLSSLGSPPEAGVNMHLPQFRHIFSEDAYAAGYYGYLWAQILEADAFSAFEEAGDPFDTDVAQRLYQAALSVGNARNPSEAFCRFRLRAPDPAALARKRGLAQPAPTLV
jgi:peptidyl-dipeptidase Dcp